MVKRFARADKFHASAVRFRNLHGEFAVMIFGPDSEAQANLLQVARAIRAAVTTPSTQSRKQKNCEHHENGDDEQNFQQGHRADIF
jgi:hypothetical protein